MNQQKWETKRKHTKNYGGRKEMQKFSGFCTPTKMRARERFSLVDGGNEILMQELYTDVSTDATSRTPICRCNCIVKTAVTVWGNELSL